MCPISWGRFQPPPLVTQGRGGGVKMRNGIIQRHQDGSDETKNWKVSREIQTTCSKSVLLVSKDAPFCLFKKVNTNLRQTCGWPDRKQTCLADQTLITTSKSHLLYAEFSLHLRGTPGEMKKDRLWSRAQLHTRSTPPQRQISPENTLNTAPHGTDSQFPTANRQ